MTAIFILKTGKSKFILKTGKSGYSTQLVHLYLNVYTMSVPKNTDKARGKF